MRKIILNMCFVSCCSRYYYDMSQVVLVLVFTLACEGSWEDLWGSSIARKSASRTLMLSGFWCGPYSCGVVGSGLNEARHIACLRNPMEAPYRRP